MATPVKILHLEDVRSDADIVKREMQKSALQFEWLWVSARKDFQQALSRFQPDIILCDHSMPGFSSAEAVEIIRDAGFNIPFILITATLSEDIAVMMLRKGITDYILKDRMQRLPAAVTNALEKWRIEREKQQYLAEIINNEARFRALIENSYDAITVRNAEMELIYRSPSANRMLGIREHEGYDHSVYESVHPEDAPALRPLMQKVLDNPGQPYNFSLRVRHRNGHYIWVEGTMRNFLNEPNIGGIIFNFRDITERMEANLQRERITEQLLERNKNLEQFAYIVSHNLRAPVANILGISNVLTYDGIPEDQKREILGSISASARRLDEVITDLNVILQKKKEVGQVRQPVNFQQLIDDIMISLEKMITRNSVSIVADFGEVQEIESVKSYWYSILYNLVTNAIKYRQPSLHPVIKIRSSRQGDKIRLVFQDNGSGIDMKTHGSQVFGLYKRFHPGIEGKGMGLFMIKTQVETMGGTITVNSEVNRGTEFTITL
jgi:PAS domain S-box-containing protein